MAEKFVFGEIPGIGDDVLLLQNQFSLSGIGEYARDAVVSGRGAGIDNIELRQVIDTSTSLRGEFVDSIISLLGSTETTDDIFFF